MLPFAAWSRLKIFLCTHQWPASAGWLSSIFGLTATSLTDGRSLQHHRSTKFSTSRELREKLVSAVHRRLIPRLFCSRITAALSVLNGFFGSAIFDKEENSLFIARDRFGVVKPCSFTATKTSCFFFASR
jgi:hypothetical protein